MVPSVLMRDPCGIVHVVMRAISTISLADTTETSLGSISPCRLKFTTKTREPSGVTCAVAGKLPSMTLPSTALVAVLNLVSRPKGVPCAVVTKYWFVLGATATPCGPATSMVDQPTYRSRSIVAPAAPKRMRATLSTDSLATSTR